MSNDKLLYWSEMKEKLTQIIAKKALGRMFPQETFNCSDQDRINDRIMHYNEGVKDLAMDLIEWVEADMNEQQ